MKVMEWFVLPIAAACLSAAPLDACAEGQVIEEVKTYAISGQSGAELYSSIGQHGPKAGVSRAIALTNFKLTWSRNYQPSAGGTITNFVGIGYSNLQVETLRSGTPASASISTLAAGTYKVGFCVNQSGSVAINNNDYVNGWVIVTN